MNSATFYKGVLSCNLYNVGCCIMPVDNTCYKFSFTVGKNDNNSNLKNINDRVGFTEEEKGEESILLERNSNYAYLNLFYRLENTEGIIRFLENNKDFIEMLYIINNKIKNYFGDCISTLQHDSDPEENNGFLSITVSTKMDSDTILSILDKFDDEWWLKTKVEFRKKIIVKARGV